MTKRLRPSLSLAAAFGATALLGLQGCSSPSKGITDDGRAAQVVFPDPGKDAWRKDGVYPNLDNLRAVGPGITKDQLYALIGPPHFSEGMAGVREWDYIFHLRKPGGAATTCQFKVIFDKNYKGQSFHWLPADCGAWLSARRGATDATALAGDGSRRVGEPREPRH